MIKQDSSTVSVFNGSTFAPVVSFNPYQGVQNPDGVFVALGDVEGDDTLDIVTGTGRNAAADVRVCDATSGQYVDQVLSNPQIRVGVPVGVFDWDSAGKDDVLIGRGPGAPGRLDVWHYSTTTNHWLQQDGFLVLANTKGESVS
jgi:hypothetical protein